MQGSTLKSKVQLFTEWVNKSFITQSFSSSVLCRSLVQTSPRGQLWLLLPELHSQRHSPLVHQGELGTHEFDCPPLLAVKVWLG